MLIFRVFLIAVYFLGLVILITQIVVPGLRGRPLFPLFRKQAKLESDLAVIRQAQDDAIRAREYKEETAKLQKIETGTDSNPNKE